MSGTSTIEWTDATWNPVTGCDEVSPGCAHCYAKTFAERWRGIPGHPYEQGFDLRLWPERLTMPLRWRKPRLVFVNSMSDLFHEGIPFSYIDRVFEVMAQADRHTFQVLTKRPERMLAYFEHAADHMGLALADLRPWPNVWLGTSIENRRFVGRADVLRQVPAAVRFISAEPLLGPLVYDSPVAWRDDPNWSDVKGRGYTGPQLDLFDIDWLIVGGESGPRHRTIDPDWVRGLRDSARFAGTAFFFKQWGGHRPKSNGRELDGRTWDEMPQPQLAASGELLKYLEMFADAAGIPKDPS